MSFKSTPLTRSAFVRCLVVLCLLFALTGLSASSKELKYQAMLVWATNAETSPNPNHKPIVDADVLRKLKELPLKWKNYFQVRDAALSVSSGGSAQAALSDKCKIVIKDVDGKHAEVSLIGKDEPLLKRTQPLPKGEILVFGGNAPDSTAWLVVLKRVE